MRTIMCSRLYQLNSQPAKGNASDSRFYSHYNVKRLAAEPLLDAVDAATGVQTKSVMLKPGESKKIEITIQRRPGFKGNVTLDTVYQHLNSIYGSSMPPGVSIDERASRTLLTGEQTKGHITLKAAADAKPVEKQQVPVMAHVSINFVMKWTCCGEPLFITVANPTPAK
jgi:hypothetical protein